MNQILHNGFKRAKRLIIGIVGFTVLLIGLALIVLPGPAFVVLPIGLAILASEFAWARLLLRRVRNKLKKNGKKPTANH